MAYGIEIKNSSGKVLINTTWPNPQVVESSTYNTVSEGSTYPSTGISTADVVVARPIATSGEQWVGYAGRSIFNTISQVWGNQYGGTNNKYASSFAYYRLREGQSTSTSGYGIIVYEADGTTPIFNSNGLAIHYEIAAVFRKGSGDMAWFNIPSGDSINDYFCVINGKKQVYYLDSFFGELIFHDHYIYDYANSRIGAAGLEKIGGGFYQGDGIIGKII